MISFTFISRANRSQECQLLKFILQHNFYLSELSVTFECLVKTVTSETVPLSKMQRQVYKSHSQKQQSIQTTEIKWVSLF